jgi:hypothetical protein
MRRLTMYECCGLEEGAKVIWTETGVAGIVKENGFNEIWSAMLIQFEDDKEPFHLSGGDPGAEPGGEGWETWVKLSPLSADLDPSIEVLAVLAAPVNDDEWGSERQVAAENEFFEAVEKAVSADVFEKLEVWCLKATTAEMIEAGLKAIKGEPFE